MIRPQGTPHSGAPWRSPSHPQACKAPTAPGLIQGARSHLKVREQRAPGLAIQGSGSLARTQGQEAGPISSDHSGLSPLQT